MTNAQPVASQFAEWWVDAWNCRDVEAVLAACGDDITFTSPTAARVVAQSKGTVSGKAALRHYWTLALSRNTDLRFRLERAYDGVDTVAIEYRTQQGKRVVEVLTFEDGLITSGHALHEAESHSSAGRLPS